MIDLLKKNHKIIINTDIDGVLSGLILHNFLGCEIVGYSNSDDTVWIDKHKLKTLYDAVYIDMFVSRKDVACIDQHIVCVNETHLSLLKTNILKKNPNIENSRFHLPDQSYYRKYPFGTAHYIIAEMEHHGIKIDIDTNKETEKLKALDYILRADDAMKTTLDSPYTANAREWWRWLRSKSKNGTFTNSLILYLDTLSPAIVSEIKTRTTQLLTSTPFYCSSPDGGFKNILNAYSNTLKPNVKEYLQFLSECFGFYCFDMDLVLTPHIGKTNRQNLFKQYSSSRRNAIVLPEKKSSRR